MGVLRRISCTDPTEDMHRQLLVARRGQRGQLGAAIARRLEGRGHGDNQRHRESRIDGRRNGRTISLLAIRGRATLVYVCSCQ